MQFLVLLVTAGAVFIASISSSVGAAYALPDASEAEEAAMTKVTLGKTVSLNTPSGRLTLKVKSLTFGNYLGPNESGTVALRLVVRNSSREWDNGLVFEFLCDNSNSYGSESVGTNVYVGNLPPRTQESGMVFLALPPDLAAKGQRCANPRVVFEPSYRYTYRPGLRDFAAIIKIPKPIANRL